MTGAGCGCAKENVSGGGSNNKAAGKQQQQQQQQQQGGGSGKKRRANYNRAPPRTARGARQQGVRKKSGYYYRYDDYGNGKRVAKAGEQASDDCRVSPQLRLPASSREDVEENLAVATKLSKFYMDVMNCKVGDLKKLTEGTSIKYAPYSLAERLRALRGVGEEVAERIGKVAGLKEKSSRLLFMMQSDKSFNDVTNYTVIPLSGGDGKSNTEMVLQERLLSGTLGYGAFNLRDYLAFNHLAMRRLVDAPAGAASKGAAATPAPRKTGTSVGTAASAPLALPFDKLVYDAAQGAFYAFYNNNTTALHFKIASDNMRITSPKVVNPSSVVEQAETCYVLYAAGADNAVHVLGLHQQHVAGTTMAGRSKKGSRGSAALMMAAQQQYVVAPQFVPGSASSRRRRNSSAAPAASWAAYNNAQMAGYPPPPQMMMAYAPAPAMMAPYGSRRGTGSSGSGR
jgi:hypothetical protein